MLHTRNDQDLDFAATAALLGDASRARILQALADGRALPATELARSAAVTPQTASTHLARLVEGRMVRVEQFGRHRYFCLTPGAAELLETLPAFKAAPVRRSTEPRDAIERNLRFARTCYRHLAGTVGTAVTHALCDSGRLRETENGYELTRMGRSWLLSIDIDAEQLRARPLTRRCLDWSERRPHLGGSLGVALLRRFMQLQWLTPLRQPRCLRLTPQGHRALKETLSIQLVWP